VDVRNQADGVVYSAEKDLGEAGSRIPDQVRADVERGIADVKQAIAGENVEAIRSAAERLTKAALQISAAAAGSASGSSAAAGGSSGEDVVDAEFEDVDGPSRNAGRS
jgi:molecular chaperone DnaK